jgi:hypothetical protein
LQIENSLTFFFLNETISVQEDECCTTAPEATARMGSLSDIKTEFSERGRTLAANQLNMDILITQLARIMSSKHNDVSSHAHGQQWWWRWILIAATGTRPYYSRDAEKMVGHLFVSYLPSQGRVPTTLIVSLWLFLACYPFN